MALGYASARDFGVSPDLDRELRLAVTIVKETLATVLRQGDETAQTDAWDQLL